MHILVSFCNLRAPGVPALGLLNAATFEFHVLDLPPAVARCGGITGLAQCDRFIYVAAQPSESTRLATAFASSVLLIFSRRDLSLVNHYAFRSGTDIHSLLARQGRLYAVATGTDEVIELRLRNADVVSETCYWRPDRGGPREDLHHLNSIALGGDALLVAAFGKKASDRWHSARDGFIINTATGETLAAGLDQPHSLVELGPAIVCCESRKRAVRVIGDERVQHLPGYSRGLCRGSEHLFVATSIGRQRSRSSGVTNNPADDGLLGGQCTISRLSMATFEIERTVDLGAQAQEIYELLAVSDAANWPIVDELAWRNSSIRELATLLDERTKWARQSAAGIAQRDASLDELRQALDMQVVREKDIRSQNDALQREIDTRQRESDSRQRENDALQREIAELRKVNEQQSASLESLRSTVEELRRATAAAAAGPRTNDSLAEQEYLRQLSQIRQIAAETLLPDSRVAVVSKGDEEMLKVVGKNAWHFPQTLQGVYAGAHPVNSLAAIAHVEALRLKGAEFLLFPGTAFWWFEHYVALRKHLEHRYRELPQHDACRIFDLGERAVPRRTTVEPAIEDIIDQCERRLGSCPAILDWNSGLGLAKTLTRHAVFSPPPAADSILPYLEQSVDIVVVGHDPASMDEARRVASAAVVTVSPVEDGTNQAPQLGVEWQTTPKAEAAAAVSLICLASGPDEHTRRWQAALHSSLPGDFAGEVLWADAPHVNGEANPPHVPAAYAAACNRAAQRARGEVLIFLYRLIPLEGWLAPLVDLLRCRLRAGVVGGRILTADARLEQAGGVAFSDASLAGFGHGDYQIDDPLYGYVREADYCGDALLATTRTLFDELSGFDSACRTPAYAHADYCLRARQRGFCTFYQPESVAVSFAEATDRPSTPLPDDVSADRMLFGARWKSALDKQPFVRQWHDRDTWHALAVNGEPAGEVCR